MKTGLSSAQLKCMAIIAMIIDHIAWVFVPTNSIAGFVMHLIGRFTGPIMFFFIAEGYKYTRDINRYISRLLIFGAISQIPYSLAFDYPLFIPLNIMFTLALGLWALDFCNKSQQLWRKVVFMIFDCLISMMMDWYFLCILIIYIFSMESKKNQIMFYSLMVFLSVALSMQSLSDVLWNLYNLGMFVPLIALQFYNGKRGKMPGGKWSFYLIYPIHLAVLAVLKFWLL